MRLCCRSHLHFSYNSPSLGHQLTVSSASSPRGGRLYIMRAAIVVAIVFALALAASAALHEHEFAQWARKYGKSYTAADLSMRLKIFSDNLDFINDHNTNANATFSMALNHFADLSHSEFLSTYVKRTKSETQKRDLDVDVIEQPADDYPKSVSALPTAVDWRNQKMVTPVKDQGNCGSCWSFAAVGAMESAWLLANHSIAIQSEQQMLDCVYSVKDICEEGGDEGDALDWTVKVNGSMSEAAYPYTMKDASPCKFNRTLSVARFVRHIHVKPHSDETALATAIVDRPTTIAMDASQRSFQHYEKGVYQDAHCKNGMDDLDHAILAVGFGVDTASGENYYIVKNSWGVNWGLAGFFWILKDGSGKTANMCGVATDCNQVFAA